MLVRTDALVIGRDDHEIGRVLLEHIARRQLRECRGLAGSPAARSAPARRCAAAAAGTSGCAAPASHRACAAPAPGMPPAGHRRSAAPARDPPQVGQIGQRARLERLAPREVVPGQRRELLLEQPAQAAQLLATDGSPLCRRRRPRNRIASAGSLTQRSGRLALTWPRCADPRSAPASAALALQLLQCRALELLERRGLGERALPGGQLEVNRGADLHALRELARC